MKGSEILFKTRAASRKVSAPSLLQSCRGLGLIEVVVSSGILAIVLVATSSVLLNAQQGAMSVQKRLDAGQLSSFINTVLTNQAACDASGLVGKPAPVAKLPTTPDVQSVPTLTYAGFSFDDSGSPNSFFDNGQIKIQSLKYHSVTVLGSVETVTVRLLVNVQGSGAQPIIGGNTLAPFDFPVVFNVLGGNIASCGASASKQVIAQTTFTTCSLISYGSTDQNCNGFHAWPATLPDANYSVYCELQYPAAGINAPEIIHGWSNPTTLGFNYYVRSHHSGDTGNSYTLNCSAVE